ncbi:putative CPXV181 protein [Orthopoxvirus Abatino]|uniref:Putative CPXV181 protein n=1 Tax=Orthopoxvirus Abatino TaxID=2478919 RepID=A0A3G2KY36_9POXV|nr:putative CPXV181 protein [Orthopoxvirus Abatino]AYN64732.1 putative CPXV181 protein [Orthopoxvirus Abatino]
MDKIKITVDSKIGSIVTISYNLEKITIDVTPKKKKEKDVLLAQSVAVEEAKDVKTEEKNIVDITDDDDMDVESSVIYE